MDNRQEEIHKGLRSIGEEIAAFYKDALIILDTELDTKSYLLAHLAREIESGLSDVFYVHTSTKLDKCSICKQEIAIGHCEKCGQGLIPKITHKTKIMDLLGVVEETELSKLWYSTAEKFHKYAHRHGVWKSPREKEEFLVLWENFNIVLEKFIGDYYTIEDRLDQILRVNTPTKNLINTLPNLLIQPARNVYFFRNLKSPLWLSELDDNGFFAADKNPPPVEHEDGNGYFSLPQWPVLIYLEIVAEQNQEKPKQKTSNRIVKIVDEIIDYTNEEGKKTDNAYTAHSLLKIVSKLPLELISEKHFKFYKDSLNTSWDCTLLQADISELFFKRFIHERNFKLILRTLQFVLDTKENDSVLDRFESIIGNVWLKRCLDEFKTSIIEICGLDAIDQAVKSVEKIIAVDNNLLGPLDIKTIEDETRDYFPDNYTKQITYLIRDGFIWLDALQIKPLALDFIKREHTIFQRLAIHTLNYHFEEMQDMFWNWKENPVDKSFLYKPELYSLFKNQAEHFTDEELQKIKGWIESTIFWISDEKDPDEDLKEKINAYGRKELYHALIGSNKEIIQERYDFYNQINKSEIKHPGQNFTINTVWGDLSPLSVEEVHKMELNELISYFDDFKEDPLAYNEPTKTGLERTITEAIKISPEKYICDIDIIINASIHFQNTWMRGILESWKSKKHFVITEIFHVINQIISVEEFWELNNSEDHHNYSNQFINEVSRFISEGCTTKNEFDKDAHDMVKLVLTCILKNDHYQLTGYSDIEILSLNTSRGNSYIALILFSLMLARKGKANNVKWDSKLVSIIDERLNSEESDPLLLYTLGRFLPNLLFISEEWVMRNITYLFDVKDEFKLKPALIGLLTYNQKPSTKIFELLKANGVLLKMLSIDFTDINTNMNRIISRYILLGYSHGWILVNDSLIKMLIGKLLDKYHRYIVEFYWSYKEKIPVKIIPKIKPLWRALMEIVKHDLDKPINQKVLSGLSKWVNWLDTIDDDVFEWLSLSMRHIKPEDKFNIIDILSKHCNITPEKVADLLLIMYTKKVEYSMSHKTIKLLVEKLYEKGLKEKADRLCILHGENGVDYLKSIYLKYNPS